jgi:polar amino acid transport system substrate-binding protein
MRAAHLLPLLNMLSAGAAAQPVQLHVMDIPPMSSKTPGSHGVVGEIVLEAMKRAGMKPQLVFMPKNRSILIVQMASSVDTLILPIARSPDREAHFTWISALYRAERGFFTTGRRIDSLAQGRDSLRTVAVSRGTVNAEILKKHGFLPTQLYEISQNDDAPRMLLEGRMDAWFGPIEEMHIYLAAQSLEDKITAGAPVVSTENYLACSRRCNPKLVERLAAELARMEKDGTSKAIRVKHGVPRSGVMR